ncbi:hypothetical protein L1887_16999 [Cichorium endivia]|nr:hypothetical protein L1887_16999 [Cichorium endivia]
MMKVGVMVELFEEYQMVMGMLRARMRSILNETSTRTATPYSRFHGQTDSIQEVEVEVGRSKLGFQGIKE